MPISPQEVQSKLDDFINFESLKSAIQSIDQKLSNPEYAKDWVCGKGENSSYHFSFSGTLSMSEKEYITKAYSDVGWGKVEVINSVENSERCGAWGIRLYIKPQL